MCVNGVALDPAQAEALEARLRMVATPILGGFGPMPSAAVARLHQDPEDPVPAIGDGLLLERLDDWAIEAFLRVADEGSPLVAAEIRHLGGALASPPPGAGARGHLEGQCLLFGVGIPGAPAPAADLEAYLDRYLAAMPRRVEPGQQARLDDRDGLLSQPKALDRIGGRLRAAQGLASHLDIDPHGLGCRQDDPVATGQRRRRERPPQTRQHRRQRTLARGHPVLAPDRLDEGVARHGPVTVHHEEREQQPPLPSP